MRKPKKINFPETYKVHVAEGEKAKLQAIGANEVRKALLKVTKRFPQMPR